MKNYENTKISVTNLRKLIRLYIYSKKFEKKVSQPLHKTYEKEFFLINNIWLKDFKKVFNYNSKKQKLDARNNNTNSYESFGTEDSIKNLYQNTDFPFIKLYNNGKDIIYHNIKYINNSKIITEFDNQNKKNNLIYKNFAILDKTTLDILVKGYNVDMFPKINMLLCENSIIFRVTNGIEIGFLNQFDNINHLFLLKFKDNNTLEQEYNKIKLNGIGNYFKENKLKKSEINKQKINNIGEVINLQNKTYNKFLKSFKSFLSKIIESDTSIKIKTSSCIATEFVRKRILSYDKNKSAMFSVINCFISCEEIIHYFLDEKNTQIFNQNKNKFMLSSNISILINELYSQNNSKPYYPDIFLTIINMIFPNDQNNFKEFIKFLLTSLHSEINDIDNNLKIDNQITKEDHLNKEISEKKFFESYKNNIRSIISDNFFWIMQTKKTCNQCKTPSYFYREMYLLELDLKQTNRYMLSQKFEFKKRKNIIMENKNEAYPIKHKLIEDLYKKNEKNSIHISNCIEEYITEKKSDIKTAPIFNCPKCGNRTNSYLVKNDINFSPNYFIFILNREKDSNIKIDYSEELNLDNYFNQKNNSMNYELMGVIIEENEENNYISLCKSVVDGRWYKFSWDSADMIMSNNDLFNDTSSWVLFYKKKN